MNTASDALEAAIESSRLSFGDYADIAAVAVTLALLVWGMAL